ncbi:hypothetical protein E3Q22_03366 [Wallemia mellicola]|uniref:Signal recognition particle subunit SRP14 n=2 Tax=Wallemia mellicola TaxID=1708541 RepID=A0A4T0MYG2_9BASI|nr:hypothetical protein WALSEDRAFT_65153 [Wallemia mellicola CBS 633.66]TIB73318.1 hypothetical protein E3Q23_03045 [Wallemia mellicola]EIM20733.1 hypothetical protein WALSEDRAFT_65153 [Wallemia mellicola CBS 633.66]TIB76824.1 hypothetical protein E3Q22_03366 [Wallemia mellicola]TIB89063.1 hypothetical protein E3Q19_03158 [Wallemia mellicola]TIB96299.1 hypothetical protein E3Q18_03228 [Wallemia mellicola]|eukprot:XP_006959264.1 hypothetical protein WALSEDRAFT_65153 [Wallemia mellicola CBS 633.66]
MAPHVTPEEFIKDLTELFRLASDSGTVFLTQKRYDYNENADSNMNNTADSQYDVLLRASAQVGDKQHKTATRIASTQLDSFIGQYNSLLHQSLQAKMRKRDRKREKRKADIAAIRKRKLETPTDIPKTKRGAGRRKFQRKVKAEQKRVQTLNKTL